MYFPVKVVPAPDGAGKAMGSLLGGCASQDLISISDPISLSLLARLEGMWTQPA
jgi:hypothetical protein